MTSGASGKWRGKHNLLSRGTGADQASMSRGRLSPLELPHYDEQYARTLPRICCHALPRRGEHPTPPEDWSTETRTLPLFS